MPSQRPKLHCLWGGAVWSLWTPPPRVSGAHLLLLLGGLGGGTPTSSRAICGLGLGGLWKGTLYPLPTPLELASLPLDGPVRLRGVPLLTGTEYSREYESIFSKTDCPQ